jgi:transcriptional regulator of acetoin/glycerol metabolism
VSFSAEAGQQLFRHGWPLNVRELERTLAAMLAVSEGGRFERHHLPSALQNLAAPPPMSSPRERLQALLRTHRGNVSAVARAMGTSRSQVRRLAARQGVDLEGYREET